MKSTAMTDFATSADGTRIAFEIAGDAPEPLVYVHGAGGDRGSHPDLKAGLASRYRIVSYDRRGRGDSDDGPTYDLMREVEDLRAIIATCGTPPVVFAVSLGARIAFELLRDPPDLAGMVLFEAPATDVLDRDFEAKLGEIGGLLASGDTEGAVVRNLELLHGKTAKEIAEQKSRTGEWLVRVANAFVSHREMVAVHLRNLFDPADYAAPGFPVHLLVGTRTIPFIRQSADLLSSCPFVHRRDLEGANHSAPTTEPDRMADIALDALQP